MPPPADFAVGSGGGAPHAPDFGPAAPAKVPRSTLLAGAAALLLLVLSITLALDYFARKDLYLERRFEDAERALKTLQAIAIRAQGVLDPATAHAVFDAIAHQRRAESDAVLLLREDGTELFRLLPDPTSAGRDHREPAAAQHYPMRSSGRYYGRAGEDGIRRHGTFLVLDPLPLVAVYTFDAIAADEEARVAMFPEIYTGATALFGAMCFAGLAFAAVRGGERTADALAVARDRSIAYAIRLDAILQTASDAILILGPDMRITHYNRAAETVFGVPATQAIGGTIDRFVPDRVRPGHVGLMSRQARAPEFSRIMGNWRQVQAQHASGRCFPAMISISKSTDRGTASYMAIVRDMTEQLAAEHKLRDLLAAQEQLTKAASASDSAKSLFLASMSHELRTPLNAIVGYSEALTLGYAGPIGSPKAREYVGDILRSGQHLHALIDRVLDLSRIQSGEDVAPGERTLLAEAIRESLRIVDLRAREKGIAIRTIGEANDIGVGGDQRRIVQILLNILGNAIKFSPAGGRIDLEVAPADGPFAARIAVVDTGPGMSVDVLARIGKPFIQERDLMVANNDGVGLGLSIVCEILVRLGGQIVFRNRDQGGLEAVVYLAPPTVAS